MLIAKPYSSLTKAELGPEGCTPCEEDQVKITLKNGLEFKACKRFAGPFKTQLEKILDTGRKIESVLGYRVSMSKGQIDSSGRRTEFSHHAFGSALDINENRNGLYTDCLEWGPHCRLIKGGAYSPMHPLSIREKDEFVTYFKEIGFQWGGKIQGIQKDFMHFSLDGY